MYDLNLLDDEKIIKIIDDVLIYKDYNLYSFIITDKRLIVLDYPTDYHNSMEDLRKSGKMNYIRMKEIIFEKEINKINKVLKKDNKYIIRFDDDTFIEIDNSDVYNVIKKVYYEDK